MSYEAKFRRFYISAFGVLTILSLSACALDKPTAYTQRDIKVVERSESKQMRIDELDDNAIETIAENFRSRGRGVMDLMVTYDPASRTNTARQASEALSTLVEKFSRRGVKFGKHEIFPINDSGIMVLIDYQALSAQAPEDCTTLMDTPDVNREENWDYELGCMSKSYLAKQIYNPGDLLGRESTGKPVESRPSSGNIETYKRTGTFTTDVQSSTTN